jgi:hypothetical protein
VRLLCVLLLQLGLVLLLLLLVGVLGVVASRAVLLCPLCRQLFNTRLGVSGGGGGSNQLAQVSSASLFTLLNGTNLILFITLMWFYNTCTYIVL